MLRLTSPSQGRFPAHAGESCGSEEPGNGSRGGRLDGMTFLPRCLSPLETRSSSCLLPRPRPPRCPQGHCLPGPRLPCAGEAACHDPGCWASPASLPSWLWPGRRPDSGNGPMPARLGGGRSPRNSGSSCRYYLCLCILCISRNSLKPCHQKLASQGRRRPQRPLNPSPAS